MEDRQDTDMAGSTDMAMVGSTVVVTGTAGRTADYTGLPALAVNLV